LENANVDRPQVQIDGDPTSPEAITVILTPTHTSIGRAMDREARKPELTNSMTESIHTINSLLARLTMLMSFVLEVDASSEMYRLLLRLGQSGSSGEIVTIRFKNIAELKMDVDAGGWVQLMMLRVELGEEGFERRYVVKEREHGVMSCRCASVELD
jgi:hypothetical protein